MKIAARTMLGLGLFVLPFAIVYWFLSYEEAGSLLLLGVTVALVFLGTYLVVAPHSRALPEDDPAGVPPVEDDIGWFPTGSIWPLVAGAGTTLAALGLAFSVWLALPGAGLLAFGVGGMIVESARAS
jgi:hypothetical protein